MHQSAIGHISNFILYCMWFAVFDIVLTRKYRLLPTVIIQVVCFFPYYIGIAFLPHLSALKAMLGTIPLLVPMIFLFSDKLVKKLLTLFLVLTVMIVSEFVFASIFWAEEFADLTVEQTPKSFQIFGYSFYLICNAVLLVPLTLFMRRFNSINRGAGLSRELMIYSLFPISQYFLLLGWIRFLYTGFSKERFAYLFIAISLCIAVDIALYRIMIAMAQRARLQAKNEMLEGQIEAQKEHYLALTQQYENVRHMRHDISNHLYTMQILLEHGQTREAAEYAASVQAQNSFNSSLGQCCNPVIDAFIFHRAEELKKLGIEMQVDVKLPKVIGIENSELISAFGNLLDNAEEACIKTERKYISVRAYMKNGYLNIETENSFPISRAETKSRRVPELDRGVGFHILNDLAETYDGDFSFHVQDDIFHASLILKGALADAEYSAV